MYLCLHNDLKKTKTWHVGPCNSTFFELSQNLVLKLLIDKLNFDTFKKLFVLLFQCLYIKMCNPLSKCMNTAGYVLKLCVIPVKTIKLIIHGRALLHMIRRHIYKVCKMKKKYVVTINSSGTAKYSNFTIIDPFCTFLFLLLFFFCIDVGSTLNTLKHTVCAELHANF